MSYCLLTVTEFFYQLLPTILPTTVLFYLTALTVYFFTVTTIVTITTATTITAITDAVIIFGLLLSWLVLVGRSDLSYR
jgi:hypothetical protein